MLNFLFPRLTPSEERGAAAFQAAAAMARQTAYYRVGKVPDTIDGRFALLATIVALLLVRIEHEGEAGNQLSIGVTERFIAAMEVEHRELGLGDPALGRTVRKLVGSLSQRVDLWRSAIADGGDWDAATKASLYKADPGADALNWSATALRAQWSLLAARDLAALESGGVG